jgi:hypothetical protein
MHVEPRLDMPEYHGQGVILEGLFHFCASVLQFWSMRINPDGKPDSTMILVISE